MYGKFTGLAKGLRSYHHVKVNQEFKEDCKVWIDFLTDGKETFCRPFIDLSVKIAAEQLDFSTDASENLEDGGFGCVFRNRWIKGQWNKDFLEANEPSITYLELVALTIAILTWIPLLRNKRIQVLCDNQGAVAMINNTSAKCKRCMRLIRILMLESLKNNLRVFSKFIPTKENGQADALSRNQMARFWKLSAHKMMNKEQDKPTKLVWPIEKVWNLDN